MEYQQDHEITPSLHEVDDIFGSDFDSDDEEPDYVPQSKAPPHLPYEVLEHIVNYCDAIQLFNFTRVNSTFRRLAYGYIARVRKIPWYEPLAIHLLNNQKPREPELISPEVYIKALRVRVVVSQNGFGIIQDGRTDRFIQKVELDEGTKRLYAPKFELKDYCPSWSKNWWMMHLKKGGPWVIGVNEDVNFVLMGIYRRRRLRRWLRGLDKRI